MCGLFGIINKHKRLLDKRAFITLGCVNDNRGGDSCGIMIDSKIEKSAEGDDKYFQCWYPKSKVLTETICCKVALGHCRKASVGKITINEAQPVSIYDTDGNLLFCVIHNGTIYNYEKLAQKYIPEVDITDMTDSQVMTYIFFYAGYDVLKEYIGAGAFVIYDGRNGKTYFFRGSSILSNIRKTPEDERPFYYVVTGKSIIFSSIYYVLQGLYWKFNVHDIASNYLFECDGEKLKPLKHYDRSKIVSVKPIITSFYNNNTFFYPQGDSYCKEVNYDLDSGCYIETKTGEILNGEYNVNSYGIICSYESVFTKKIYFYNGIMLCGKKSYETILSLKEKKINDSQIRAVARRLSATPILIGKKYYTFNINLVKECCSGTYNFPLTYITAVFNTKGKIIADYNSSSINNSFIDELSDDYIKSVLDYVKKNIQ